MKQGDFSQMAQFYHNRPGYDETLVTYILKCAGFDAKASFDIADVGAGTGKLTQILRNIALKANITAIEPNEQMREHGKQSVQNVSWLEGSAENTGLQDNSQDIIFMASSFHWARPEIALPEFARALKDNGLFCAIWNPRELEAGSIFAQIEDEIKAMLPSLERVSSGTQHNKNYTQILQSTGDFKNCVYMECDYSETMSKERYMGIWHSVNDIQAQAIKQGGQKLWEQILKMIEYKIAPLNEIVAKYKIKAYIVQKG